MKRVRRAAQAMCFVSALLLLVTTGFAAAQDVPSHTQVNPDQSAVFDFPAQLTLFKALAVYANGIITNVSQGNFSNADAQLANYSRSVDNLVASVRSAQPVTAVAAAEASRQDFSTFINDAKRYNALYVTEMSLDPAAVRSNESIANALEMKSLNSDLKDLQNTIAGRNADIYSVAVANGLDLSQYGNNTQLLRAYGAQVDSRLSNVTARVYLNSTLTLFENKQNATYGDVILLTGTLTDNQTRLSNRSVEIRVSGSTSTVAQTNATGAYAYQLPIANIGPGTHTVVARYAPNDAPYNPSQSPTLNFSVTASPVNNTLSFLSPSIALGSNLQARGKLTTTSGPVANATVMLALGGMNVSRSQTDQNGTYMFSVPTTQYYLPAVFSGATAYTVFVPSGQPLSSAASAAVQLPVDTTAAYGTIALVVLVVLLCIYAWHRGYFRRAPAAVLEEAAVHPAERLPAARRERVVTPLPLPTREAVEPVPIIDWNAARDQARDLFKQKNDELATKTLFDAALASLSATAHVRLPAHMTYSEKSWALQSALPDASGALRELTKTYEVVHYSARSLTEAQRDAALNAFDSLREHVQSAGDGL